MNPKLAVGLIVVCILSIILFSINAGIDFLPMSTGWKVLSIVIPTVLGFIVIPGIHFLTSVHVAQYTYHDK